jgi:hypothetical protein
MAVGRILTMYNRIVCLLPSQAFQENERQHPGRKSYYHQNKNAWVQEQRQTSSTRVIMAPLDIYATISQPGVLAGAMHCPGDHFSPGLLKIERNEHGVHTVDAMHSGKCCLVDGSGHRLIWQLAWKACGITSTIHSNGRGSRLVR